MEEFLEKIEKFKYNLNLADLENFRIDEKVEDLEKIEKELVERNLTLEKLQKKLSNTDNYKKNGQELYDIERKENLLNIIKENELKKIYNDFAIKSTMFEVKYAPDNIIKEIKEKELEILNANNDKLVSISSEYQDILKKFEINKENNNDLDEEQLNNDRVQKHYNKEEIKKLELRKSVIEYDYRKELDTLIDNVKNNNIDLEKAKEEFNKITSNIDQEFLENDLINRDEEEKANINLQKDLEYNIKQLENKLENKDNYLKSMFVVERNNDLISKWEAKKDNVYGELNKYELDNNAINNNIKEYSDIIELCINENLEIQRLLRKEKNEELEKKLEVNNDIVGEATTCLNELNQELDDNKKAISNCNSKKERIENIAKKLNQRDMENEIDKSTIRLDEIKLANMKSDLNALKNRKEYVSVTVNENIDQVNDSKEPEPKEIVSIKRPIKTKIIEKIKKVAKVVLASMTTMVVVASFNPKEEELDFTGPHNNFTMEDLILEDDLSNSNSLEEDIIHLADNITIKEEAGIYKNQYDSSNKTNPYNPRYDRGEAREVIGISLMDKDGNLTFVQNEDDLINKMNEGYTVSSYLTEKDNAPEGFWNANDVVKEKTINSVIDGGMHR